MSERFDFPSSPIDGGKWSDREARPKDFFVRYAGTIPRIACWFVEGFLPWLFAAKMPMGIGIPLFVAWVAYNNVYLQGTTGQSLLKKVMGLRVCLVLEDMRMGQSLFFCYPGIERCAIREVAHVLDLFFFIGFFRPAFNAKHRTLADSVVRTVVIRDDRVDIWNESDAREIQRQRGAMQ